MDIFERSIEAHGLKIQEKGPIGLKTFFPEEGLSSFLKSFFWCAFFGYPFNVMLALH